MPLRAAEELEDSATATASDFDRIEKKSLADRRGVTLREFKAGLRPRYARVWLALLLGHAALAATLAGEVFTQVALPVWAWPGAVVLGACVIGYTLAYIQLFFHEAAHYNLARDRRRNDLFADLFIGSLIGGAFGQGVADYRIVHFDHHRYLGTTQDTERSYFKPLTGRFILEALTGIQALRVIAGYRRAERKGGSGGAPTAGGRLFNRHLARSLVLHVGIIAGAVWCRQWTAAAAWVAGVALVYPFFGAVRQVLEHRSLSARADVDYAVTDHGAVNRMFGDGLLASTLGGAGFNRHLLHHWEPQISCTRLRDLETYLLGTPAADALAAHRTSYLRTFAALLKANERSAG